MTIKNKSSYRKSILLFLLAAFFLAGFGWWHSNDFIIGHTLRNLLGKPKGLGSVKPPSFKVVGTTKPTFTPAELMNFRKSFENREFASLVTTASAIHNALEGDLANEYKYFDFYDFFEAGIPEHEALFDEWVNYSPRHYAPYLARAHYYYAMGWQARGDKFASETDAQNFGEMFRYFQLCRQDIEKALSFNSRLITAYSMLLGIANASDAEEEENRLIDKGSSLFPDSFLLYYTMLWTKLPRWGGSFEEMNGIARRAYDHVKKNQEIHLLFGSIYTNMAMDLRKAKKFNEALALTAKALEYGDHYSFYEEQARILIDMNEYASALDDINKAISLRPNAPSPYLGRAMIYAATDRLEETIADLDYIEARFPQHTMLESTRKWCAGKFLLRGSEAGKSDSFAAIAYFDKALMIQECDGRAYHMKGHAYAMMMDFNNAISALEKAAQCGYRDIMAFKMLDYCLAYQQRWDDILQWWAVYLAWDPENGEAYLERAGTYKHKGDSQSALADLKRACDLGQRKACTLQQQYR